MTIVFDKRPDASLAVYIDGDLQFDSRDEALYHELLALPALALATRRQPQARLRVLICGGGDGLAARELLKSPQVQQLDLVDYDPTILELARSEWAALAAHSLSDPRVHVHVQDAVAFVAEQCAAQREYDLIICDFTVPREAAGARLYTVEWFVQLHALLTPRGVLATNAASPSQTPGAYWSIYNSLRAANLHPRPYRFVLPSFTNAGYGDDWGFVLGARQVLGSREFSGLDFATPRQFLVDAPQLRRCFTFPNALAALREDAPPTGAGSEWLLQALFNPTWEDATGHDWDALSWGHDPAALPAIDRTTRLLPPDVQAALNNPALDEQAIFEQVIEVMPALRADQTRSMVREFIAEPGRFLANLDLPAIVEALLQRAAELPARLVAELRGLRKALRSSWQNPHSLLQRGLRVVSMIAIVIMLANLVHPDTAYGKGSTTSDGTSATSGQSFTRTTSPYDVVQAPPETVSGRGFSPSYYGNGGYAVDELGTPYPTRRYRYYRTYSRGSGYRSYRSGVTPPEDPNAGDALYRLTPETDLLGNGEVVIALTDQAYLLLGDEVMSVVNSETGLPLVFLQRDPSLVWRTKQELDRQRTGLKGSIDAKQNWIDWIAWMGFAPWRDTDERELANITQTVTVMDDAITGLGTVPAGAPPTAQPPIAGALQLFSGVWVDANGTMAILELPDDQLAFMDRAGWWSDQQRTRPLDTAYPDEFRRLALLPYLTRLTSDYQTTETNLKNSLASAQADLTLLKKDKTEYTQIQASYGPSDQVEYGSSEIRVDDALRRTDADIARTEQLISVLQTQQTQLPLLNTAAQRLLATLK